VRHPRARTHVDHPNAGVRTHSAKLRRKLIRAGFLPFSRREQREMFGK
jgi:hypothetical protein